MIFIPNRSMSPERSSSSSLSRSDPRKDHDGRLGIEECAGGLRRLAGVSRTELCDEALRAAVRASDLDHSGHLDWAEWLAIGLLTVHSLADARGPYRVLVGGLGAVGEAGLVVEFAQRLLCRICIAGQNEAVAKWL